MFPANGEVADSNVDACTVVEVLHRISGKWAIGILVNTYGRPIRFTELERRLPGISRRMLTLTLRNLERDGLVERTVFPTVPPRVEYSATVMAGELREPLASLVAWAEHHRGEVERSRRAHDGAAADGDSSPAREQS